MGGEYTLHTLSDKLCTSAALLLFDPEPLRLVSAFLMPTDSSSISWINMITKNILVNMDCKQYFVRFFQFSIDTYFAAVLRVFALTIFSFQTIRWVI